MSYYLYRHIRLDKNEVFYIGIGKKFYRGEYGRARQYNTGRNNQWRNIYKKLNGNIDYEIMYECEELNEIFEKEKEFIKFYGRRDLGLGTLVNMSDGGDGNFGRKLSEETKAKISAFHKGRPLSPEHIAIITANNKARIGYKHSPETIEKFKARKKTPEEKEKLRQANLGKKPSAETIEKLRRISTGKFHSKEAKLKIGIGNKGKRLGMKASDELRKKLSLIQTGRKHSEETKAKMRLKAMGRERNDKGSFI